MRTNLRGAFLVSRAAARVMQDRGGGRIVNLSSPFARVGLADRVAYSVSKAGLEQLTRSLAVEWAPYGITVNAVAPTTVVTETRQHCSPTSAALRGAWRRSRSVGSRAPTTSSARCCACRRGRCVRDRRDAPRRRRLHDAALMTPSVSVGLFGTEPVARMVELAQAAEELRLRRRLDRRLAEHVARRLRHARRRRRRDVHAASRHRRHERRDAACLGDSPRPGPRSPSSRPGGSRSRSAPATRRCGRWGWRRRASPSSSSGSGCCAGCSTGEEVVADESGARFRLAFAPEQHVPIYVARRVAGARCGWPAGWRTA